MISEIYISKARRDSRYKDLKAQGINVFRRTTGLCRLHPEHIRDSHLEGISYESGFGNTDYLRMWDNLYKVESR